MNDWHKYKNYLFKTLNSMGIEVKVVIDQSTNKTFFCADDLLAYTGYKKDPDGAIDRTNIKNYQKRLNIVHFFELFPNLSFIPMENMKTFNSIVFSVSGSNSKKLKAYDAIRITLNAYIAVRKEKIEIDVSEDVSDAFITIGKKNIGIATYDGKTVAQVTDVMRYCGYKEIKVKDNMREFCVKIQTKKGIVNFVYVSAFPLIAKTMANEKYSDKLNMLYSHFSKRNPSSDSDKLIIDKERSVVIFDHNVIEYRQIKDVVYFQSSTIQSLCGYSKEKTLDNFKEHSLKIDDIYFMSVSEMKSLTTTRMTQKYKDELNKVCNTLHRFA